MTTINRSAFRLSNAVLANPPGDGQVLHVKVDVEDGDVRHSNPGFDGMEEVFVRVNGEDYPATYRGNDMGMDQHVVSIPLPEDARVNSVALGMDTNVGRVWAQGPGQDLQVHDVGAVSDKGVDYVSPLKVTQIAGYHTQTVDVGDSVYFDANSFGARGNLIFNFEMFAPGKTSVVGARNFKSPIEELDLKVVSPLLGNHEVPLQPMGRVGPDGNNLLLTWSLANTANFQGPNENWRHDGRFPVKIMAGDEVLHSFDLVWRADR